MAYWLGSGKVEIPNLVFPFSSSSSRPVDSIHDLETPAEHA